MAAFIHYLHNLLARWLQPHRQLLCRIDAQGCTHCGGTLFETRSVIDDALAATWELDSQARQWFDEREGHFCQRCRMSKRVRMLLWSLRRVCPDLRTCSVLHLNQINELTGALAEAALLVETVHRTDLEPGATVGQFQNEDLCHLTFPDHQFDVVIHSETLEHVLDYENALMEATRVLKPGGVQLYTVPLLNDRLTRQRTATDSSGAMVNLLPPSAHGGHGEYPVVWEFGRDFFARRRPWIYRIQYDDFHKNPTVFTIIERRRR